MTDNERYKRLVKLISALVIILAEGWLFWIVWTKYYNPIMSMPFWRRGNWLITGLYVVLLVFFLSTYGGFKVGMLTTGGLVYSHILCLLIDNTIAYVLLVLADKYLHSPLWFIIMTAADIIVAVVWAWLSNKAYRSLYPRRSMLVVYGDMPVSRLINKINSRNDKFYIKDAVKVNGNLDRIFSMIDEYGGVLIGDIPSHERNLILKYCYEKAVRCYTVPKLSDIMIRSSDELNLFDTQLLLLRNEEGLPIDQGLVKRLMDIVISGLGLVITSPVFLIAACAIKLQDGGPVFYKQTRLTKGRASFEIYKFRTMIQDAEKDGIARLSAEHDSRITPVGSVLRSTRLDELPQLINILKGEMSIVGPRPERPEIAEQYEKEIPEFAYRLRVKAGLTGMAQVYGKYNTTPYDKLKLDLTYIVNYSTLLDIRLICLTPKILFIKEATEGVDDGAIDAAFKDGSIDIRELVYGRQEDLNENDQNRT